ncbi:MAG: DUF397 domain-containing protein [Actinobacteria bacterium]|nr:DUF397 domain-containing protein [Actinomycetota bacterium]
MTRHNPVESSATFAPNRWVRATVCGPDGGNCVEVNSSGAGWVALRDSKQPDSPILVVSDAEWHCFVTATRTSQYDKEVKRSPAPLE